MPVDRGVERPEGLAAVVAGQNADVVDDGRQQLDQPVHRAPVHIDMQIADLQDRKAVERGRQLGQHHLVAPDPDALGIFAGPPIKPGQL